MQPAVTCENVNPIERRLTIQVPELAVRAAIEAAYVAAQEKAQLKGFRKGKVPRHLLEQHYHGDVEQQAMETVIRESFPAAVAQSACVPLSQPRIEPGDFLPDAPFQYVAIIEVKPELTIAHYTGLALEHEEVVVAEEEIDAQLTSMQDALTKLAPVAEDAVIGPQMVAKIDFEGTADGKSFEGSSATDFQVDIGGGNLLPDFEQQLHGLRVGDETTIQLLYPEDYFNVSLAGSRAKFSVKVKEMKQKLVPTLNDEFAKEVGDYQTLPDLRMAVHAHLSTTREGETRSALGEIALRQIAQKNPFEIPQSLVGWELETMYRQMAAQAKEEGDDLDAIGVTPESFVTEYQEVARDRARKKLILDAIATQEKLSVADDETEARLKAIAESLGEPLPKVRLYYEQQKLFPVLKEELLREKSLDFVLGKAKITVKQGKKGKKK